MNSKKIYLKTENKKGDFIEIWQYSEKNKIKRKNCFYLNSEEIWDLKWNLFSEKKIEKAIAICCGFKIKIIEIPMNLPQYTKIFSLSINIYLIDIFQWILNWTFDDLVTGDIHGKIIIYNLKKNLSIRQIFKQAHKNSPIGSIKTFFDLKNKKSRFLISGGFDGYLKLWDLNDYTTPLFQISYFNSKILDIKFFSEKFENIVIFVGLDNGMLSIFSLVNKFEIIVQHNHQGNFLSLEISKNLIITIGDDGDLNIIEFNSPSLTKKTSLTTLFSCKRNLNQNSKFKITSFHFQNADKKFCNKVLNLSFISKKECITIAGGISGIIIFLKFCFKA